MSDALENLDPDGLEAEMERQEAYELSPAGIAEQNQHLLRRQREFRLAADAVTAAWSERPEVAAVALFGSVAGPLWKEVLRFRTYRRAGIALWHECKDLDLALWLSNTTGLGGLRKAKARALAEMYKETGIGVASHQVDVFVLAPGTDRYLGRLCDFARCPKHKPECLVPGCGAVPFLQQHEGFGFDPEALAPDRVIRLFDRQSGSLQMAAEATLSEQEADEDVGLA
jgi:hypothetical protein